MTASADEGGRAERHPQPPQATPPRTCHDRVPAPTGAPSLIPEGSRGITARAGGDIIRLVEHAPAAVAAILGNAQAAEVFVDACDLRDAVQVYRSVRDQVELHRRKQVLKRIVERISKAAARVSENRRVQRPAETRSYKPGDSDWDLDSTLERMNEDPGRPLTYDDIRATTTAPRGVAVCLVADKSQSVGAMLHDIAVACAVACHCLRDELVSVILFDRSVEFARRFDDDGAPERAIERIIDMDAGGATDLFRPLIAARDELDGVAASRRRRAILVSDLVATRGHDPARVAADLPSLDVLCVPGFRNELPELASAFCSLDNVRFTWAGSPGDVTEAMLEIIVGEHGGRVHSG